MTQSRNITFDESDEGLLIHLPLQATASQPTLLPDLPALILKALPNADHEHLKAAKISSLMIDFTSDTSANTLLLTSKITRKTSKLAFIHSTLQAGGVTIQNIRSVFYIAA